MADWHAAPIEMSRSATSTPSKHITLWCPVATKILSTNHNQINNTLLPFSLDAFSSLRISPLSKNSFQ